MYFSISSVGISTGVSGAQAFTGTGMDQDGLFAWHDCDHFLLGRKYFLTNSFHKGMRRFMYDFNYRIEYALKGIV